MDDPEKTSCVGTALLALVLFAVADSYYKWGYSHGRQSWRTANLLVLLGLLTLLVGGVIWAALWHRRFRKQDEELRKHTGRG